MKLRLLPIFLALILSSCGSHDSPSASSLMEQITDSTSLDSEPASTETPSSSEAPSSSVPASSTPSSSQSDPSEGIQKRDAMQYDGYYLVDLGQKDSSNQQLILHESTYQKHQSLSYALYVLDTIVRDVFFFENQR